MSLYNLWHFIYHLWRHAYCLFRRTIYGIFISHLRRCSIYGTFTYHLWRRTFYGTLPIIYVTVFFHSGCTAGPLYLKLFSFVNSPYYQCVSYDFIYSAVTVRLHETLCLHLNVVRLNNQNKQIKISSVLRISYIAVWTFCRRLWRTLNIWNVLNDMFLNSNVYLFVFSRSHQFILTWKRPRSVASHDAPTPDQIGPDFQEDSQPATHSRARRHVLQQLNN